MERSMDDPPISCATCLWWAKRKGGFGDCKRYPPKRDGGAFMFPKMHAEEWCGEWVAKSDKVDPFAAVQSR